MRGSHIQSGRPATGVTHRKPSANAVAGHSAATDQLEGFIRKYDPEMATQIRDVLARMRARLPAAVELVHDNYNALAIGFASGERVADVIFSIACYPRWVSVFFFPASSSMIPTFC